ncbi:MAG: M23 family metallopeptidase [Defluviitaleaceae bacterium]|nr:M23 family metallopeptidase [Defluviitaleaceae bacterium]
MKKWLLLGLLALCGIFVTGLAAEDEDAADDYIKWVDFDIPLAVMKQAYKYDVDSKGELDFVQLLAYAAAKNWGSFRYRGESEALSKVVARVRAGEYLHTIASELKLYEFYFSVYNAVLGNFIGHFEKDGEVVYGLKAFSPIAKNYHYSHSDDFGNPRSYGYRRPHLGHDMFGSVGTPIIAVECGVVEALGWNQYGGWRIGIRTHDTKRYYYYAHLQRDKPYAQNIALGSHVRAGDVIGYLGNSGYSRRENVCNIKDPHLHFGLQIIFNEAQKDGNNQIWIDTYNLIRFLNQNRMPTTRGEGGEAVRAVSTDSLPLE